MIAQMEGGLMDYDTGVRVATAICTACERAGLYLWDPVAQIVKYLHTEANVSDAETQARTHTSIHIRSYRFTYT